MRRPAILQTLKARLRPMRWLALAAFLLLVHVIRILLGEPSLPAEMLHFMGVFLILVGMVAVTPIPWQWTGDDRRKAPFFRGLAQALVWDCAWLLIGPVRVSTGHPLFATLGLLLLVLPMGWIIAELQAAQGDRAEAEAARSAMEVTARQAQAQALKAQLDPHVLYNALSGISELIREEPARAETAVVSLAELYRTLTALSRRETVRLEEERNLVQDYLAVEHVRLGRRLRVSWEWPEALDLREVPPLLIQPLVENAIKHGLSPHKEGGEIRITAAPEGSGLRFTVADDGVPLSPSWRRGTGLSNLAARLEILGGGSRMELRQAGAWTLAELWLWPAGAP